MNRRQFLATAAAILAFASANEPARAAATDPVAVYLHARHAVRQPILPSTMLTTVLQSPADYFARVIELSGSVSGFVSADQGRTLLLSTPTGTISIFVPSAADGASWLGSGSRVRALVAIKQPTTTADGTVIFTLSASGLDYDIAEAERIEAAGYARRTSLTSRSIAYTRGGVERVAGASEYLADSSTPETGGRPIAALAERARSVYGPYRDAIRRYNTRLSDSDVDKITTSLLYFSDQNDIDPRLVVAMIIAESGFDIYSTSSTGAMGLSQLMPGTASGLGVTDPYDPIQNIGAAVHILRGHLDKYGGAPPHAGVIPDHQIALAMAAYNAGAGAVKKYHGVPPYRETQRYVARVIAMYRQLRGASQ